MTRWDVTWTKSAREYYEKMAGNEQEKMKRAVKALEVDPFSSKKVKRLHGKLEGLHRYRVGKFRMVFTILAQEKEVRILAIASRGSIYK